MDMDIYIYKLATFVLENNFFEFKGQHYRQISGTAMGTPFAVSYANIYMSWWMRTFYFTTPNHPDVTYRFIDDLATLSTSTEKEIQVFIEQLNQRHDKIKFTAEINKISIPFLDVRLHLLNQRLETDLYSKPTTSHRYLPPNSCHPPHIFKSIIYSGSLRIRRICSKPEWCETRLKEFAQYLKLCNYKPKVINQQIARASTTPRPDLLKYKPKKSSDRIPWVATYDPRQPNLRKIGIQNQMILNSSTRMKRVMPEPPIIAFRRPASIGDILHQNRLKHAKSDPITWGCKPCYTRRCACCSVMENTKKFHSTSTGVSFQIKDDVNCKSANVIYALTCRTCKIQYIGKTTQPLHKRLNGHRSNINTNKTDRSPYVVPHFRTPGHSLKDNALSVTALCLIRGHDPEITKQLESLWISRAGTIYPRGLNDYDPSGIPN